MSYKISGKWWIHLIVRNLTRQQHSSSNIIVLTYCPHMLNEWPGWHPPHCLQIYQTIRVWSSIGGLGWALKGIELMLKRGLGITWVRQGQGGLHVYVVHYVVILCLQWGMYIAVHISWWIWVQKWVKSLPLASKVNQQGGTAICFGKLTLRSVV